MVAPQREEPGKEEKEMKEVKVFCDICGKEFDTKDGIVLNGSFKVECAALQLLLTDVCSGCLEGLRGSIRKYISSGGKE